jgi:phosphate/sulfate permease
MEEFKKYFRPYHVNALLLIAGGIILVIFADWIIVPFIAFIYALDIIHDGIKEDKENNKTNKEEVEDGDIVIK